MGREVERIDEAMTQTEPDGATRERDLVREAQVGDRWAFGELVRLHRPGVVNVVYRMCGDGPLAEDAVQECFIRAWERLDSYSHRPGSENGFRNWLYRIATNCALNLLRQDRPTADVDDVSVTDPRRRPESSAESLERIEAVRQAVLALPPASRSAVVLREYEGLSYREIAEALDIPIGTVMSRLNYGRRQLREGLARYLETPREAS